jgi:hypothetical protein
MMDDYDENDNNEIDVKMVRKPINRISQFERIRHDTVTREASADQQGWSEHAIEHLTIVLEAEDAAKQLKEWPRVPIFAFLSLWSIFAVYTNWATATFIDWTYSLAFVCTAIFLMINALQWCGHFYRHWHILNKAKQSW